MNVLLGSGDHPVAVTPNYQTSETDPLALGQVTEVALDADWDLDAVAAAIRPDTRVVSVDFPNHPTGEVIDAADFTAPARLCDERGTRSVAASSATPDARWPTPPTCPLAPCP